MTDDPKRPPSQPLAHLVAGAVVKGGVGAIPLAGPGFQELLGLALGKRHQDRMNAWLADLAAAVAALQAEGKAREWEELLEDDRFVDVVLTAARAAEKTGRTEKLRALRGAVMSSAAGTMYEDDLEHRFLDIIDRSVPAHLDLVLHLLDPQRSFAVAGIVWDEVVETAEAELPWGHSAEPPAEMYLSEMRPRIRSRLIRAFPAPAEVSQRLLHDLDGWQLLRETTRVPLTDSYASRLGASLLDYVGITGETARAFEAFAAANR